MRGNLCLLLSVIFLPHNFHLLSFHKWDPLSVFLVWLVFMHDSMGSFCRVGGSRGSHINFINKTTRRARWGNVTNKYLVGIQKEGERQEEEEEEECLLRRSRYERCLFAFRPHSAQMPPTSIYCNNLTEITHPCIRFNLSVLMSQAKRKIICMGKGCMSILLR